MSVGSMLQRFVLPGTPRAEPPSFQGDGACTECSLSTRCCYDTGPVTASHGLYN